ncbi:uncharacterized protein LOC143028031 [Oratosquilla oratoria]|uniref:uncharacterized protein LOC143028031 n=1 Tax=Oratosquilla oratoria TaxID=337810 RepID=UPI003F75C067
MLDPLFVLVSDFVGLDLMLTLNDVRLDLALASDSLRHTDFISQFTTDLRYIKGTDNSPSDALSRNSSAVTSPFIDYRHCCRPDSRSRTGCRQTRQSNPVFQFKKILLPGTDMHIYADVSTKTSRPFLPKVHRLAVFHKLHNLSHSGIRVLRHTRSPAATFTPVSSRFEHVHTDLVNSLPFSNDYRYILTCVDYFTHWPEAAPLPDISTDSVARACINTWISRFGVPLSLTSDRGGQFESNVWNKLMNILGIQRIRTASYHPQANGTVERFHRQLKAYLIASAQHEDWLQALPHALRGICTSFKEDLQHSSAGLVYKTTLKLPGQLLAPAPNSTSCHLQDYTTKLTDHMRSLQPMQPRTPSFKTFVSQDLDTCTHVFIRVDAVKKRYNNLTKAPSRCKYTREYTWVASHYDIAPCKMVKSTRVQARERICHVELF